MIKWTEFHKWFNRDFWRAFTDRTFPIQLPKTAADKEATVRKVFNAIKSARYAASIPEAEIVANKGFGVARTIPVFCIEDYIVYYYCVKQLEEVLCGNRTPNTFGGWSLGGKRRKLEETDVDDDSGFSSSRYSFNPRAWTAAFGEFNSLLFAQLDTGAFTHVLQFDLSNFYDCVRLDILERWIREEANSKLGWVIALLFYFLNQWNRRNTGLHPQAVGVPQDALADCSRILANYYLQQYDQYAAALCRNANAEYFRYADDQMILLRSTEQVDAIMLMLTRNLDRYGLRVNQKKVDLWTVEQLQQHRCRKIQAIFAKKGDSKEPAVVRKFVDAYLAIPKLKLLKSWNSGLPLLNRLLFANIESLPQKQFEKLMVRYTASEYLLRVERPKLVRIDKLNQLRRKPINLRNRLKKLGSDTVHNAFHYEALGFAKDVKDEKLTSYFQKRVANLERKISRAGTRLPI